MLAAPPPISYVRTHARALSLPCLTKVFATCCYSYMLRGACELDGEER